jgi:hypothetical protein
MQVCIQPPDAKGQAFSTPEELLHHATSGVAQVFRYWDRIRGDRAMPSAAEIDFLALRPWLPGLLMIEVGEGERRTLTYRVVGERAVRLRGYDPTGLTVDKAGFGPIPTILSNYGLVIDRGIPLYGWNSRNGGDPGPFPVGTLLLPLSSDGKAVDRVLVYVEDSAAFDRHVVAR